MNQDQKFLPVVVSIVSHGHGRMVEALVHKLLEQPSFKKLILTLNIPEELNLPDDQRLSVIRNQSPKGFGENHNNAFELCDQTYFAIVNPDVDFKENVLSDLIFHRNQHDADLIAPLSLSLNGSIEDCARSYPTPQQILSKLLGKDTSEIDIKVDDDCMQPDWVPGIFMLVTSDVFKSVGGFDTSYFLYYEDTDLCYRLRSHGHSIYICPKVTIIHDAQRASHKNARYFYWHVSSMLRFFIKRYVKF